MNHLKRFCLYYHLGLCPCPPMLKSSYERKLYKANIRHLIQFFEGETKKIIKELERERDWFSGQEMFENSLEIQKKIDAIKLITSPKNNPFEYELNPNLRSDLRTKEMAELLKVLRENKVSVSNLKRIECYDI